jgi:hypothetical protein
METLRKISKSSVFEPPELLSPLKINILMQFFRTQSPLTLMPNIWRRANATSTRFSTIQAATWFEDNGGSVVGRVCSNVVLGGL